MFYSKNPKKNIMASTKHQDFFNIDDIKHKNQQWFLKDNVTLISNKC